MARMLPPRLVIALAATGVLGLAAQVPAASAASGVLGTGAHPAIAVDAGGVGHVAWVASDPNGDVVHYCRLERTDPPTCGNPQTLTSPDGVVDDVQVLVDGGDVRIIMPRNEHGDVQMWSSSGGGPFSGPFQIATGPVGSTAPDAVLGADGAAYFTNANPGPIVQQVPVHGGQPPGRSASFTGAYTSDPTIGVFGASSLPLLAAHGGQPDRAAFWRYNGTGDVNDPASWAGPVVIGDGDATRLASGPAGLFLMTNNAGGSSGGQVLVRRFDEATGAFGAPVIVGPSEAGVENDLAEAAPGGPAAGALFAVWQLSSSDRMRVAASGDGGRTWLGPGDLLRENNVFGLRAAVAPDGRGFVAWDQNSDSGQVKAAPLVASDDTPPALGISKVGHAANGNPQWTVSCPANEAFCAGSIALTISSSLAKASAAAAKRLKIGSKAFRIAGGKKKKVTVKVNKKGRAVLKRRKHLRVTATFETTDKDGNKSKVDKIITLNQGAFRHS